MLRRSLLLVSLLAAVPAVAQDTAAPGMQNAPPPEFIAAAQGFGQCLARMVQPGGTAATEQAPEAAAQKALAGCATEKTALDTRFEAWIAGPGFPEAGRAAARAQYKAQMDGLEVKLAGSMRNALADRAAAGAAPAPMPSPTPAPSPTPRGR